jgi:hypothetical protein
MWMSGSHHGVSIVKSSVAVPQSGCGRMCSISIRARSPKRKRQTLIRSATSTCARMPAERPSLEKLPSMTETSSRNFASVRRLMRKAPLPVTTNPYAVMGGSPA